MPKMNKEIKNGNKRIKTSPQVLIIYDFKMKEVNNITKEKMRLEKLRTVEKAIKKSTNKNFNKTCCLVKKSD